MHGGTKCQKSPFQTPNCHPRGENCHKSSKCLFAGSPEALASKFVTFYHFTAKTCESATKQITYEI